MDLAIDGDPETFWLTSTYETGPALEASGKPGVGIVVETGEVVIGRQLEIQTPDPGWTFEVYGIEGEVPDDLEGWGEPISSPAETDGETIVELNEAESDHFLIWITELTENPENGFFATVGEITLFN